MDNSPLPPQININPLNPLIINLLLHMRRKRNGTHNPIPKLLVQHSLIRIPIILHYLIQSINQRFLWRHLDRAASIRHSCDLRRVERGLGDVEELGEVLDVFWAGVGLAVEERCGCYLVTAEGFGDGFEGEVFGLFLGEEHGALGGEAGDEVLLW